MTIIVNSISAWWWWTFLNFYGILFQVGFMLHFMFRVTAFLLIIRLYKIFLLKFMLFFLYFMYFFLVFILLRSVYDSLWWFTTRFWFAFIFALAWILFCQHFFLFLKLTFLMFFLFWFLYWRIVQTIKLIWLGMSTIILRSFKCLLRTNILCIMNIFIMIFFTTY